MSPTSPEGELEERTVGGLHDHVFRLVIEPLRRGPALDLGAGSGAFAARLAGAGFDVLAADREPERFRAGLPCRSVDLNAESWMMDLGEARWPLVTAIEVIEHLEAPIAFLRQLSGLLAPDGIAVVTTPNVDSLPARLKFLLRGRIRMLDEHGDPTHISPIFWDLLHRQYLPRAGLRLVSASVYPPDGFMVGRPLYRQVMSVAAPFVKRPRLLGDNHVLILSRNERSPEPFPPTVSTGWPAARHASRIGLRFGSRDSNQARTGPSTSASTRVSDILPRNATRGLGHALGERPGPPAHVLPPVNLTDEATHEPNCADEGQQRPASAAYR